MSKIQDIIKSSSNWGTILWSKLRGREWEREGFIQNGLCSLTKEDVETATPEELKKLSRITQKNIRTLLKHEPHRAGSFLTRFLQNSIHEKWENNPLKINAGILVKGLSQTNQLGSNEILNLYQIYEKDDLAPYYDSFKEKICQTRYFYDLERFARANGHECTTECFSKEDLESVLQRECDASPSTLSILPYDFLPDYRYGENKNWLTEMETRLSILDNIKISDPEKQELFNQNVHEQKFRFYRELLTKDKPFVFLSEKYQKDAAQYIPEILDDYKSYPSLKASYVRRLIHDNPTLAKMSLRPDDYLVWFKNKSFSPLTPQIIDTAMPFIINNQYNEDFGRPCNAFIRSISQSRQDTQTFVEYLNTHHLEKETLANIIDTMANFYRDNILSDAVGIYIRQYPDDVQFLYDERINTRWTDSQKDRILIDYAQHPVISKQIEKRLETLISDTWYTSKEHSVELIDLYLKSHHTVSADKFRKFIQFAAGQNQSNTNQENISTIQSWVEMYATKYPQEIGSLSHQLCQLSNPYGQPNYLCTVLCMQKLFEFAPDNIAVQEGFNTLFEQITEPYKRANNVQDLRMIHPDILGDLNKKAFHNVVYSYLTIHPEEKHTILNRIPTHMMPHLSDTIISLLPEENADNKDIRKQMADRYIQAIQKIDWSTYPDQLRKQCLVDITKTVEALKLGKLYSKEERESMSDTIKLAHQMARFGSEEISYLCDKYSETELKSKDLSTYHKVFDGLGKYQGTIKGIATIIDKHHLSHVADPVAEIFGNDYKNYLNKIPAKYYETHPDIGILDVCGFLPQCHQWNDSDKKTLKDFLTREVYRADSQTLRKREDLQVICRTWTNLSAIEKNTPYVMLLETAMMKDTGYENVVYPLFAKEAAKCGVDVRAYKADEEVYLAAQHVPEAFDTQICFEADYNGNKRIGRFLPRSDARAAAFGQYTDCCQHLTNAGRACAISSMIDPYSQVFVIEDTKGAIVAGSWVWYEANKQPDGTTQYNVCFDNVEAKGEYSHKEILNDIYEQAAKWLCENQGAGKVCIGCGCSDINTGKYQAPTQILKQPLYSGYSDARRNQVLIYENQNPCWKEARPDYYVRPYVALVDNVNTDIKSHNEVTDILSNINQKTFENTRLLIDRDGLVMGVATKDAENNISMTIAQSYEAQYPEVRKALEDSLTPPAPEKTTESEKTGKGGLKGTLAELENQNVMVATETQEKTPATISGNTPPLNQGRRA